jgi:hypothetical protein
LVKSARLLKNPFNKKNMGPLNNIEQFQNNHLTFLKNTSRLSWFFRPIWLQTKMVFITNLDGFFRWFLKPNNYCQLPPPTAIFGDSVCCRSMTEARVGEG